MIDRVARDRLAEATRHYLTGLSTNFEFDDSIFSVKNNDPSIAAIRNQLWLIYDDLRKHFHRGQWILSEEQRVIVLRIILFLKSDYEYIWPVVPWWYSALRPLIWVFTFGVGTRHLDGKYHYKDELNIWPFANEEEINTAKNEPKYLASVT